MDMKEIHAEALSKASVALHEFLLAYKRDAKIVFAFVEGREDRSFYRGPIESALPDGWRVQCIPCKGRKQVIGAFNDIDWTRFDQRQLAFFVDRDLMDFFPELAVPTASNIFVTEFYSVENYLVSYQTMERVVTEFFSMTPTQPEADVLWAVLEANLQTFHKALVPIMAQIILWRRAGEDPILNNFDPVPIFEFARGKATLRPEFAEPGARVGEAARILGLLPSHAKDLASVAEEFERTSAAGQLTRGKYLLAFFVKSLDELHACATEFCGEHKSVPRKRVSFGPANAVSVVGPLARASEALRAFIERTFVAHARERTAAA